MSSSEVPRVVAENEWLVVFDKPAGLISHRDGRTMEPSVAEWLGEAYPHMQGVGGSWVSPQGEAVPLNGLLHRLDRTTSGIMLAAKNESSFMFFKNEFKERRVQKRYIAIVEGVLPQNEGRVVAEIARSSEKPKRWYARPCAETDPRAAITEWRVLERIGSETIVEVFPKTGRTHQIRVHFSSIGHPLLGDALYGGSIEKRHTPALHAASISLVMPQGTKETYEAEPPESFFSA
jgi:23S rRNA pseudouridine1911/1915/1917 synthase